MPTYQGVILDQGGAVYNVKAYAGANDDARVAAALAAMGSSPGVLFFPAGTYSLTQPITISNHRQHVLGAGPFATQIYFDPASAGVAFTFSASPAVIYQNSVREVGFLSNDTTLNKVAVRLVDSSEFVMQNVSVGPIGAWTGAGSIGLQIRGRELGHILNVQIAADIPISIEDNPNSTIDIDEFHFEDIYLSAGGTNPNINIASGVNLTDVVFDGANIAAGGGHGIYWNDTASTMTSNHLTIRNFRWEQGTSSTGYVVYISHNYALQHLLLDGVKTGMLQQNRGFYLRKCKRVTFSHTSFEGTSIEALNMDQCEQVSFRNAFWQTGSTVSLGNVVETLAAYMPGGGVPLPSDAWYDTNAVGAQQVRIYGSKTWGNTGSLASAAQVQLAMLGGGQKTGSVIVSAKGATKNEGGSWIISGSATKKVAGTTNTADTNAAGTLSVYQVGTAVYVKNNLGETVDYNIFVTWY
jgi:hypothetical protein